MNETYPSWLFQVKLGATTMWERWDGWTPEKGFQDAGMNSFNHYAFGSVGEWIYGTAAGIGSDGPGFRKIIIRPQPGPGLDWVNARYDSINGRIVSEWRIEGDRLTLRVQIPPNTTAKVYVPTPDAESVTEGGKSAAQAEGVKRLAGEEGAAVFEIGSGTTSSAPYRRGSRRIAMLRTTASPPRRLGGRSRATLSVLIRAIRGCNQKSNWSMFSFVNVTGGPVMMMFFSRNSRSPSLPAENFAPGSALSLPLAI